MRGHPRLTPDQATTTKGALETSLRVTAAAGIASTHRWREPVAEVGLTEAVRRVAGFGLRTSSLCRGGFFAAPARVARTAALEDNRRAIAETAALAAARAAGSAAVLVAGDLPEGSGDLTDAGEGVRVRDAVGALEPEARAAGLTLAVEPLPPVNVADRAAISTPGQALDLAVVFDPSSVDTDAAAIAEQTVQHLAEHVPQ